MFWRTVKRIEVGVDDGSNDGAAEDDDGAAEDDDGAAEDDDGGAEDDDGGAEDDDGGAEDDDGGAEDDREGGGSKYLANKQWKLENSIQNYFPNQNV